MSVPTEKLMNVAMRVHTALSDKNLTHSFLGGLEMILLGCNRTTKDVDVEVKKQLFSLHNLKTIKAAFSDTTLFIVIDGSLENGFRMLCNASDDLTHPPDWVGVDVFSRGPDRLPKQHIDVGTLPFLSVTDLIVEKIRCCAERRKSRDAEDVNWLVQEKLAEIMCVDVCSRITREVAAGALNNHSSLASSFSSLGFGDSSV